MPLAKRTLRIPVMCPRNVLLLLVIVDGKVVRQCGDLTLSLLRRRIYHCSGGHMSWTAQLPFQVNATSFIR